MEWTPEWLVGAGMAVVAGLYVHMLRRERPVVAVTPEGLAVGTHVLPWGAVQRVGLAAGERGAELRIATSHGVVHARDDQLLEHIEDVGRAIVREAHLVPVEDARTPRDLPRSMRTVYVEWHTDPNAPAPSEHEHRPLLDAPAGRVTPAPRRIRAAFPRRTPRRGAPSPETSKKATVGILALLALIAKFGKFILMGLAWGAKTLKLGSFLPTALSMAVSVWAYAMLWGWMFAAGLVGLLFVHELGHAGVMSAKGLRTSPIVFLPGLGAFIGMKDQFLDARVEAETGWGGPALGALGTGVCYLVWVATDHPFWLNLAYVGGFINLFNLLPVSPLDGGRIVTAISPWLWLPGLLAAGALGFLMGSPILLLIILFGAMRAVRAWKAARRGENQAYFDVPLRDRALITCAYFGLIAGLGWLTHHAYVLGGPVS
ncbi:MAG: site-2 protease family protein [Planctomycetota bacterium]|jgi:Zn-dependent protease